MAINRKALFDKLRGRPFGGSLTQGQVDGINTILDAWERSFRERTPKGQLSYCFGTAFHETARTMQPVKEYGNDAYFTQMYDKTGSRPDVAATLGNTEAGDGARFCGRGYVQLTGRSNYRRATQKLRDLGTIGPSVDFEREPDYVMLPDVACQIMFIGMEEGWFTGVKLDGVISDNPDHAQFVAARRIINGTDRAEQIASHSDDFLAALVAAEAAGPVVGEVLDPIKPLAVLPKAGIDQSQLLTLLLPILLQALLANRTPGAASPPGQPDIAAIVAQLLGITPPAPVRPDPPKNPPPLETGTKTTTGAADKNGMALGTFGLIATSLLQMLGVVGTPFGMGQAPTDVGTIATTLAGGAIAAGATGGWSMLVRAGVGLVSGLIRGFGPQEKPS